MHGRLFLLFRALGYAARPVQEIFEISPCATLTSSNSVATRDSQSELCSPLAAPSLSRDDRGGFPQWEWKIYLYSLRLIEILHYLCTQKSAKSGGASAIEKHFIAFGLHRLCHRKSTESHFTDVFGHHSSWHAHPATPLLLTSLNGFGVSPFSGRLQKLSEESLVHE